MVEVIDPDTGKRLPPGQEGELIWTALVYQGSPLLRYRSYDISHYVRPPCDCGHVTIGKIGKPKGRRNAETKIGLGEHIFPVLFDEAIMKVHGVINYQLVIDKPSFRDRLRFTVEYNGEMEEGRKAVLEAVTRPGRDTQRAGERSAGTHRGGDEGGSQGLHPQDEADCGPPREVRPLA